VNDLINWGTAMNKPKRFPGPLIGGRGKCQYCGEEVSNVAYHEARVCSARPNGSHDDQCCCDQCLAADKLAPWPCQLTTGEASTIKRAIGDAIDFLLGTRPSLANEPLELRRKRAEEYRRVLYAIDRWSV
jgi:hypothetical protein